MDHGVGRHEGGARGSEHPEERFRALLREQHREARRRQRQQSNEKQRVRGCHLAQRQGAEKRETHYHAQCHQNQAAQVIARRQTLPSCHQECGRQDPCDGGTRETYE